MPVRPLTPACLLLALVAAGLPGCAGTGAAPPNPLRVEGEAYDRAFAASRQVLVDAGFVIDEATYRFGRLSTHPRDSPTVVEFWRPDNRTAELAAASTLNAVRRRATVFLDRSPEPTADAFDLRVEVLLERQQEVTHRLTGSVGRNVFSRLDAVPAEWARRGVEARYWEPVARDPHLEALLLARISDAAGINHE
ncbi:MAG: hypothetical protein WD009_12365 [Phycisphaeraceae bacterium]